MTAFNLRLLRLLVIPAVVRAANCVSDNCLRALGATTRSADSGSFCSQFLQPSPTVAIPTYLSACSSSTSRLSSACSCYISTTSSGLPSSAVITTCASATATVTITESASTITQSAVTVTVTATSPTSPAGCDTTKQFIKNYGFESADESFWSKYATYDAGIIVSQSRYGQVQPIDGGHMWEGPLMSGLTQTVNVPANPCVTSLHLQFWYLMDPAVPQSLGTCFFDLEIDSPLSGHGFFPQSEVSTRSWKKFDFDFDISNLSTGGGNVTVTWYSFGCGPTITGDVRLYIDRVSITPNCITGCS